MCWQGFWATAPLYLAQMQNSDRDNYELGQFGGPTKGCVSCTPYMDSST